MPSTLFALTEAQQSRSKTAQVARRALQGTTGSDGDVLPLVSEATDLEARVHRAVLSLPYIRRDVEEEVRRHLASPRPVLLVGSSMVGKTQMAVMLIKDMFADRQIVIPDNRESLASLDAADMTLRRSVIFLDDIHRLIGADGITDGNLRRLTVTGNVIVGTIRAGEYDRYQPTDQLRPPEWDVLCVFERVFIRRNLTDPEKARLSDAVSDPGVRERICRTGLGEYVGAAEHIEEALLLGPDVNPVGYALVKGAADWQRAGMSISVPASVLPDLAAPHLGSRWQGSFADEQAYRSAMQWATKYINPTVALLQQDEPGTFVVCDYALDVLSRMAEPIPTVTWPILFQYSDPNDLIQLGYTAQKTYQLSDIALKAWRQAADSLHADAAPRALLSIAKLLTEQGDIEDGQAAYQQAIESGHADVGPAAMISLAYILRERGDRKGEHALYQRVIESAHHNFAPTAAVTLGASLTAEGDLESARAAYRQAISSGHPQMSPLASCGLGNLLAINDDLEGARTNYQHAIDSRHPDHAPLAALGLGNLLRQDDPEGAQAAYQQAIDSGHSEHAPNAAMRLGILLMDRHELDFAQQILQKAIDSKHPEYAPRATLCIGMIMAKRGDQQGAHTVFQQAIGSGDAEAGPAAAANLGLLLEGQGDTEGALAAYQKAIDFGHSKVAASTGIRLGTLLTEQGNVQGSRKAYQKVIDVGDPEYADEARSHLEALEEPDS